LDEKLEAKNFIEAFKKAIKMGYIEPFI